MEALKTEARKIKVEIEEFSCRTAKEVAGLVTAISDIEDESYKMIKRNRCIDTEIETLFKEKEAIELSLDKNYQMLKSLSAQKEEMDKTIDIEMKKLKERDTEVKEIISRLSNSDPPKQANTSADSDMIEFLKQTITRKEEDILCPICLEPAQIPIFTCPDSHIICSACVPKIQECPQCRVDLPQPLKRHRFAEKTAAELEELLEKLRKLTGINREQEQEQQLGNSNLVGKEPNDMGKRTWANWASLHLGAVTEPTTPGAVGPPTPRPEEEDIGRSLIMSPSDFHQLFVGNLPWDCTEDHLVELFGKYGRVTDVRINQKQGRDNTQARGGKTPAFVPNFGFIVFESTDCVERALAAKPIMLYGNHRYFNMDPLNHIASLTFDHLAG